MMHRIQQWTHYWGERPIGPPTHPEYEALRAAARIHEDPEPITEAMVKQALQDVPPKSAAGFDQWTLAEFKTLPPKGHAALAELLTQVELKRAWPATVMINGVIFLGKPSPVPAERPITLTAGLYRLYCKVRKPQVEEWETARAGHWDSAINKSSALQVALLRSFQFEVWTTLGVTAGGLYFDLQNVSTPSNQG